MTTKQSPSTPSSKPSTSSPPSTRSPSSPSSPPLASPAPTKPPIEKEGSTRVRVLPSDPKPGDVPDVTGGVK